MSDSAPYTAPVASALPVRASTRSVVGGFLIDLALAVVVMLAVSIGVFAVWGAVLGFRTVSQGGDIEAAINQAFNAPSGLLMIWVTLLGTGTAALVPYWLRRRASKPEQARSLAKVRQPSTWAWIVIAALSVFAISAGLTSLGAVFGIVPEPTNQAPIQQALGSNPWFIGLFVVLLAPLYEELLFRRVLFGRFLAAGKPVLGMLLSALAFAVMHEIPGLSANTWSATLMLWAVYGGMGAVFAGVYWKTGTLWAPIAAHALNNALALALLRAV